MKAKVILLIASFILISTSVFAGTSISEAAYTSQSFKCPELTESYRYMKAEGNKAIYIKSRYKSDKKNAKKTIVNKLIVSEDGTAKVKKYTLKGKVGKACGMDGANIILSKLLGKTKVVNGNANGISKKVLQVSIMNSKGVVKNSYKIPVANNIKLSKIKYIYPDYVRKDKNKLYVNYLVYLNKNTEWFREYILCYDTGKNKVISNKLARIRYGIYDAKEVNSYIKGLESNTDKAYSYGKTSAGEVDKQLLEEKKFSGKLLKTYTLPEGETKFENKGNSSLGINSELSFRGLSFGKRYIYYLNRNGVYRCDTKGDGHFELIYDGKDDPLFNPVAGNERRVSEFHVLENEDFYLVFDNGFESQIRYLYKKTNKQDISPVINPEDNSLNWINAKITERDDTTTWLYVEEMNNISAVLCMSNDTVVYKNGEIVDKSTLKVGDNLSIGYSVILETFPPQIMAQKIYCK